MSSPAEESVFPEGGVFLGLAGLLKSRPGKYAPIPLGEVLGLQVAGVTGWLEGAELPSK